METSLKKFSNKFQNENLRGLIAHGFSPKWDLHTGSIHPRSNRGVLESLNKKMNKKPIGVFDSGLGGLTVVKEVTKLLSNEDIVYLGDTARVPYGTRGNKVVTQFAFEDSMFLQKKGIKCIVIACNTASAIAGEAIKKAFDLPVFEIISAGAKDATEVSTTGRIGVIATRGTILSHAYENKIKKFKPNSLVYSVACPLLVPLIEEMETKGPVLGALLDRYLAKFHENKVDTLILGCTHYPIISQSIKVNMGEIKLVNPGIYLAHSLRDFLNKNNMANSPSHTGSVDYYVTDLNNRFLAVSEMFLGKKLGKSIKQVSLEN